MELETAVVRLSALAQNSRLAVFRLLVQKGHLKELSHAGLLTSRPEGRYIYYAPDFAAMNALLGFLTDNCCAGSPAAAECTAPPVCDAC